jgi:hypothetical protein
LWKWALYFQNAYDERLSCIFVWCNCHIRTQIVMAIRISPNLFSLFRPDVSSQSYYRFFPILCVCCPLSETRFPFCTWYTYLPIIWISWTHYPSWGQSAFRLSHSSLRPLQSYLTGLRWRSSAGWIVHKWVMRKRIRLS